MNINELLNMVKMPENLRLKRTEPVSKVIDYLLNKHSNTHEINGNEWFSFGYFYLNTNRFYDAFQLHIAAYKRLVEIQNNTQKWIHKAEHAVMASENLHRLNMYWLANYYLLIAAVDDLIEERNVNDREMRFFEDRGIRFRLIQQHWYSEKMVSGLEADMKQIISNLPEGFNLFPEAVVGRLNKKYFRSIPSGLIHLQ